MLEGDDLEPLAGRPWRGWTFARGRLWSPEGYQFEPREVLSLPFIRDALATHQREASRARPQRDRARAIVQAAADLAEALTSTSAAIEAARAILEEAPDRAAAAPEEPAPRLQPPARSRKLGGIELPTNRTRSSDCGRKRLTTDVKVQP